MPFEKQYNPLFVDTVNGFCDLCPANMMLSIHATVARDLSNACRSQSHMKTQVLVAPLNGFGREVFEQSKSQTATVLAPVNMTYSVLAMESDYIPPLHEWIYL